MNSDRKSIEAKYIEVEKALIEEFVRHHRSDDKEKMAELALILSHFRNKNKEGHFRFSNLGPKLALSKRPFQLLRFKNV